MRRLERCEKTDRLILNDLSQTNNRKNHIGAAHATMNGSNAIR